MNRFAATIRPFMNRKIFYIATALLAITACENVIVDTAEEEPVESSKGTGTLEVSCAFEQSYAPVTRATEGESQTETTTVVLSKTVTHIYYVIMKDDKVYKTVQQTSSDEAFGTIGLNLDEGDYKLYVFANNESDEVAISDNGLVSINKNRVTDSFSYSGDIKISLNERTSVETKLNRCVTQVEFHSTDKCPENIRSIKLSYENVATKYSLVDQMGSVVGNISRSTPISSITSITDGDGKFKAYNYLYINKDEAEINITLQFYDASDNLLYTRYLENVQMKLNRKTIVSAALFTNSGTDVPSIVISSTWLEDYTQSF
jgi:hypothetical protein